MHRILVLFLLLSSVSFAEPKLDPSEFVGDYDVVQGVCFNRLGVGFSISQTKPGEIVGMSGQYKVFGFSNVNMGPIERHYSSGSIPTRVDTYTTDNSLEVSIDPVPGDEKIWFILKFTDNERQTLMVLRKSCSTNLLGKIGLNCSGELIDCTVRRR